MERLRVGLFTEIYRPVVNGVVASVETLAQGLQRAGHEVFCFAPKMAGATGSERRIVRIPSLPLPATPYRLTLPLISRRDVKSVIERLSVVHVHSPFITGWMGMRYARRYGMPLIYTYHTQLEAYAHYVPFEANATRFAASQLTRRFANLADAVIAPTPAMAARLRELGVTVRVETVPSGIDVARFAAGRRREDLRAQAGAETVRGFSSTSDGSRRKRTSRFSSKPSLEPAIRRRAWLSPATVRCARSWAAERRRFGSRAGSGFSA